MTLARQLILSIAILFVFLYAGNLVIDLVNTRALLAEQMQVHAGDTATSVAVVASHYARQDDAAGLETLFNAVADSGYYASIHFADLDGRVVTRREFPVADAAVPDWFTSLVELPSPTASAEVTAGWRRMGEVVVASHPGNAYESLWMTLSERLVWFGVVALMVFAFAYAGLRLLLSPLRAVERQADAIRNQQFETNPQLPRTRELNSVVRAMNRMSESLQKLFDNQLDSIRRLREQAYQDTVTGLANRAAFDARLAALTGDPGGTHRGALAIVRIQDMQQFNEVAGRKAGNELLKKMGEICRSGMAPFESALVGRRQGPEFAILVTDIDEEEARHAMEGIMEQAMTLDGDPVSDHPLTLKAGFVFQESIEDSGQLLQDADRALQAALAQPGNQLINLAECVGEEMTRRTRSLGDWQTFLDRALERRDLRLYSQCVVRPGGGEPTGYEIFSRVLEDGVEIPAGMLAPIAERLGRGEAFDRGVLMRAAELDSQIGHAYRAINLTAASLCSPQFHRWLDDFLEHRPVFARHLVLEIRESHMQASESAARDLQEVLRVHDAGLALDNFGLQASAFNYLRSLPLRYIKLHRSFVRDIDSQPDNQFYVESLLYLVHTRGIELIVEGVETEAEWQTLRQLGVDYLQGYYLGVPEPVH